MNNDRRTVERFQHDIVWLERIFLHSSEEYELRRSPVLSMLDVLKHELADLYPKLLAELVVNACSSSNMSGLKDLLSLMPGKDIPFSDNIPYCVCSGNDFLKGARFLFEQGVPFSSFNLVPELDPLANVAMTSSMTKSVDFWLKEPFLCLPHGSGAAKLLIKSLQEIISEKKFDDIVSLGLSPEALPHFFSDAFTSLTYRAITSDSVKAQRLMTCAFKHFSEYVDMERLARHVLKKCFDRNNKETRKFFEVHLAPLMRGTVEKSSSPWGFLLDGISSEVCVSVLAEHTADVAARLNAYSTPDHTFDDMIDVLEKFAAVPKNHRRRI